jgi:hypothetical protein
VRFTSLDLPDVLAAQTAAARLLDMSHITQLPLPDQLWLMERLAHHIRQRTLPTRASLESQITAMAHDPDIQRELRQIEAEFADTEADGLSMAR